jgi:hypothetical protein
MESSTAPASALRKTWLPAVPGNWANSSRRPFTVARSAGASDAGVERFTSTVIGPVPDASSLGGSDETG